MLTVHSSTTNNEIGADLATATLPQDAIWIDLLNPEAAETSFVERTTGLHVPTIDELSEIESSSRLFTDDGALYLSTPTVYRADANDPRSTPVGFVLTRERLITVRYEPLVAFTTFIEHQAKANAAKASSSLILFLSTPSVTSTATTAPATAAPGSTRSGPAGRSPPCSSSTA